MSVIEALLRFSVQRICTFIVRFHFFKRLLHASLATLAPPAACHVNMKDNSLWSQTSILTVKRRMKVRGSKVSKKPSKMNKALRAGADDVGIEH